MNNILTILLLIFYHMKILKHGMSLNFKPYPLSLSRCMIILSNHVKTKRCNLSNIVKSAQAVFTGLYWNGRNFWICLLI